MTKGKQVNIPVSILVLKESNFLIYNPFILFFMLFFSDFIVGDKLVLRGKGGIDLKLD